MWGKLRDVLAGEGAERKRGRSVCSSIEEPAPGRARAVKICLLLLGQHGARRGRLRPVRARRESDVQHRAAGALRARHEPRRVVQRVDAGRRNAHGDGYAVHRSSWGGQTGRHRDSRDAADPPVPGHRQEVGRFFQEREKSHAEILQALGLPRARRPAGRRGRLDGPARRASRPDR